MGLTLDVLKPEKDGNNLGIVLIYRAEAGNRASQICPTKSRKCARTIGQWDCCTAGSRSSSSATAAARDFRFPKWLKISAVPMRSVRMKASDYGIDPNHIGITSGSSGAHLALMVGVTGDDGKPGFRRSRRARKQPRAGNCCVVPADGLYGLGKAGRLQDDRAWAAISLQGNVWNDYGFARTIEVDSRRSISSRPTIRHYS